jgi:outer membrane protein TolC
VRVPARISFPLSALLLTSCVAYSPRLADPTSLAAEAASPPAGPLPWEAAVRWAVDHNPDLLALRARAAAAAGVPPGEPVEVEAGVDMAQEPEAVLSFDVLSILGIGPRGAEFALARARGCEAWMRHHERAREIAAALAEAYEVERALAALSEPEIALQAEAYVKAGLEPAAAETAARATISRRQGELAARTSERLRNTLEILRLLGARSDAPVDPAPAPGAARWPDVAGLWDCDAPDPRRSALVAARADVQRALASFEVADREFAKAVAAQFPGLVLSPGVGGDPLNLFGHVALRLPFGASSEARAAECAREAARLEVQGVVLDAMKEAGQACAENLAARARLEAARAQAQASEEVFKSSKARLEATGGSFFEVVFAAGAVVDASRDLREAAVEEARARVRAARALGWPGPEAVGAGAAR